MKISIKATNLTLSASIEQYIYEKIGSLDKLLLSLSKEQSISQVWVEIGKTTVHHQKGNYFKTSVQIEVTGKIFQAQSETFDIKASIDEVKDELQRQLMSAKGKRLARYLRGARFFKRLIKFSPLAWFRRTKGGREREEGL